jgi:hypothetical protein
MLLPREVLPFVQHGDARVRQHAVGYIGEAHDPSPATQDHFWDALDRFALPPPLPPDRNHKERSLCLRWLHRLAPTERSIDRLFHELRTERDPRLREYLVRAATELPVDGKLRLLADPSVADDLAVGDLLGLRDDVWLAGRSFDELWAALEECAAGLGAHGTTQSPPFGRVVCVVRALGAHPERAGERALAILRGPEPDRDAAFWEETFALLISGRVPMPAFAPRLLDLLGLEGDSYFNERVSDALVRAATPEVVEAVEQHMPRGTEIFRNYGPGVLTEIKIPASEAACLRLLRRAADRGARTTYATCLLHLCASDPEAVGAVAAMVLTGLYDAELTALDEDLLAVGTMIGWAPDQAAWEARPEPEPSESHKALMALIDLLPDNPPLRPLPPDLSVPYGARPRRTKASR